VFANVVLPAGKANNVVSNSLVDLRAHFEETGKGEKGKRKGTGENIFPKKNIL